MTKGSFAKPTLLPLFGGGNSLFPFNACLLSPPPCQLASQQREVSQENKAVGWQLSQLGLYSPYEAH